MYILAIVTMFIILISGKDIINLNYISSGGASIIYSYDQQYGTDYYKDYSGTRIALTQSLDTFAELESIENDNMQHSVHEILGIDIQDNIDKGVRYVLTFNDHVIGTDGISDIYSYDDYSKKTIDYSVFYIYEDDNNLSISKDSQFYNQIEPYLRAGGSYDVEIGLNVFYEGDVAEKINNFIDTNNYQMQQSLVALGISSLLFILICLYFGFNAGKKNDEDGIHFNTFDKVFIDFKLIFSISVISILIFLYYYITQELNIVDANWYLAVISVFITYLIIDFCSNLGKKIRVHKFWESISVIALCKFIYNRTLLPFTKFLSQKTSLSFVLYAIAIVLITLVGINMRDFSLSYIMLLALSVVAMLNPVRLVIALKAVKQGKGYKAEHNVFDFPFNSAFTDVEELSKNMVKVYKDGETAQKVKTELISNVSHDLRTPLTSIIGYVDLLDKNSENYDEDTKEYIRVIKEKSERMNTMVEDLFDLAKSANNDVQMNFETLNVKKLIEQTLSELDDVVSEEKIVVKLYESLKISADGNKMYRVMQNLIENAVKYSFDGTRIYIDCYSKDEIVYVEFKNIANYQMDFTPEEIIQRFNRGDKSRTTKGSGLGLSIAKTYTNLNNGDFKVDVDGDMFKVTLIFDKIEF